MPDELVPLLAAVAVKLTAPGANEKGAAAGAVAGARAKLTAPGANENGVAGEIGGMAALPSMALHQGRLADSVLAGASSSFLISEVMSNPRKGFCSLVVRAGDINLLSGELAGDREREHKSVTRRQNE